LNKIRTDFSNAAVSYSRHDHLQRYHAELLIERLSFLRLTPKRIVDLGCGDGKLTQAVSKRYQDAQTYGVDFAVGMCKQAQQAYANPQFICADIQKLPFAANSVDVMLSNFTLQWCDDLSTLFQHLLYTTAPEGVLLFSMVGQGSMLELEHCWRTSGNLRPLRRFEDMHNIGDKLFEAGWQDPVVDVIKTQVFYPDVSTLFREFKQLGVSAKNPKGLGLVGKQQFRQFQECYETLRTEDCLPLSWEIVYGYARKGPGVVFTR
jgi:malonyl-CoA O-methyltransferase